LEVIGDPAHIFRMGNVAELSARLSVLAVSQKLDAAEREATRRDCARRYDWNEIAHRTSAAYQELFDGDRRPALTPSNPVRAQVRRR